MREYKTHKILNTIIYVLYIPLSFFGFMCGMATDGLIDETNNIIIILTNIFWEDSGMNNLMRQVFGTAEQKNTAVYSSFSPLSPPKTEEVALQDGVMTISSGSVYSPCDGVISNVSENDGVYTVTISHSDSFSTVISGIELCYLSKNDKVYANVPVGYSTNEINVSMFDNNTTITSYVISDNEILWLT